jgi:nucleobase:cation symporter-1, NCS1 family
MSTQTGKVSAEAELEAEKHGAGASIIKPFYDERLANEDLAPLKKQSWSAYNIFAFWMSDVHSVGGYVTAGALFALGMASWQVLIALVVGILIGMVCANLVAKPSQITGVPYPVINRAIFGVNGANIPAIIRGCIAIAWYGVQTYLASTSLMIIFLKLIPSSAALNETTFPGLSPLGGICYAILWIAQTAVFWRGMNAIRRFIDWAGPAVYVAMVILCIYLVARAGIGSISLNLSSQK